MIALLIFLLRLLVLPSFDLFTAYGGSVFCGLNIARKGTDEDGDRLFFVDLSMANS